MEPIEAAPIPALNSIELPDGIRRARAAFIRDFPKVIADSKTSGHYVCYHLEELAAVKNLLRCRR